MMFLKIKKIVLGGAIIISLISWWIGAVVSGSYVNYPRVPNPNDGRTVPFSVKGIVVYITEDQRHFVSVCNWLALSSGAVALLVLLVHGGDPFKSKEKNKPK
jgi:hypothetical protein